MTPSAAAGQRTSPRGVFPLSIPSRLRPVGARQILARRRLQAAPS